MLSPFGAEIRKGMVFKIIDARDGIRIPNQVASRGRKDLHPVSQIACGSTIGQQADVVTLDSDFRGLQRDCGILSTDEEQRLDCGTIGSGSNRESGDGS